MDEYRITFVLILHAPCVCLTKDFIGRKSRIIKYNNIGNNIDVTVRSNGFIEDFQPQYFSDTRLKVCSGVKLQLL